MPCCNISHRWAGSTSTLLAITSGDPVPTSEPGPSGLCGHSPRLSVLYNPLSEATPYFQNVISIVPCAAECDSEGQKAERDERSGAGLGSDAGEGFVGDDLLAGGGGVKLIPE